MLAFPWSPQALAVLSFHPSLSGNHSFQHLPVSFPARSNLVRAKEYTRPSSPFSDLECDGIVTSRCQSTDFNNSGYAKTGPVSCVPLKRRRKDSGETHQPCYAATRDRLGLEKTQRNAAGHPALASPPSFVTQLRICADAHHAAVRGDLDSSS